MLAEAFNAAAQGSQWITWLVATASAAAVDTRAFLQTAFSHIRVEKQRDVADGIRKGGASQIEVTIHELVTHELFRRLQLRPVFKPLLEGTTPDLSFETAGMKCIADIVVCHSCSGLQTVSDGLANNVVFEPTIRENMRGLEPTLAENELKFIATRPQTARWTNIQCIQSREGLTVREKRDSPLVLTHSVHFKYHDPDIDDRGKGSFSPDTRGATGGKSHEKIGGTFRTIVRTTLPTAPWPLAGPLCQSPP